ncbi:DUF3810 domain-containing protein [Chitinophaga rhizosphaerae]|uniref:DUF3810 domain-containing protein n=1 Tax=Chitinophaga rhizosphaerae TaxID=1864947 RepID=UPI000F8096F1|nr:DUF3810 domain-containing protein [Chitinophaga rhizosphaerae]
MEKEYRFGKPLISIAVGLTCIVLLSWAVSSDGWLAGIYFHRWYDFISTLLRKLFGRFTGSIGDVIYCVWVIIGIIFLLTMIWRLFTGRWKALGYGLLKAAAACCWLYFTFLLFWGAHYQRTSMVKDLGFSVQPYTKADLYLLADTLVRLTNRDRAELDALPAPPDTAPRNVFADAAKAYDLLSGDLPELRYTPPSVKKSMFGKYLNYLGVTGYLNPFTNEAQVNVTVPAFQVPFVTCHEIAHQVGFAPEEDANFVGYLAASRYPDPRFRYAANFEMLLYTVRRLARRDPPLSRLVWNRTHPGIRADAQRIMDFYKQFEGPIDDYSTVFYDSYLKANNQRHGIRSYSEVVGWLMSYYRIR